MCGILGLVSSNNFYQDRFSGALRTMHHRGPDGGGEFVDNNVYLGHRRLSIIDIDDRSGQPMKSKCGQYVLVFNGEIYNYKDLKKRYLSKIVFRTESDTEVLLELLIAHGTEVVKELCGIFAFAFYDKNQNDVTLCRDRHGIKPLYVHQSEGSFIFASEIKAITEIKGYTEIDEECVSEQIAFGYVAGERTLIKGIRRLLPGHIHHISTLSGEINISDYTSILAGSDTEILSFHESLENAIDLQMLSDVPVGVMLCGALDFNIVSSVVAKNYP